MCVFYPRKKIQRDAVRIAQRKELNVILEEFEDIEPDNVTLLIRHSSDNYIVFIDGDSEVDYETTDAYDKENLSRELLAQIPVFLFECIILCLQLRQSGSVIG